MILFLLGRPTEPPPSYEEAMRGMPILQSSPQRPPMTPQQQQQHNRLSWQPPCSPAYDYAENRLSWQHPNEQQLPWQQGQAPPYQQRPLQRPLSYHSQVTE